MSKNDGGWSKIKVFPKQMMGKLASVHIPFLKKRVQRGLDYRGKTFKKYDPNYAEYKASRFKSKKTGKRIPSMAHKKISSTRIHPPDLTVTGDMLMNLTRKRYDTKMYQIGFTGEEADKAEYNEKNGRIMYKDDPGGIPKRERKFLINYLNRQMKKQFKMKLRNVNITIGK